MLGVGVDYGTHLILAAQEGGDIVSNLSDVLKPIVLSGLTTATGFGSLMLAQNVALSGLGTICAIGVAWCLLASVLVDHSRNLASLPIASCLSATCTLRQLQIETRL